MIVVQAADKEMQNYRQHIRTLESQPLATGGRAATDKDYDTVVREVSILTVAHVLNRRL